jgi:hypothetical protein
MSGPTPQENTMKTIRTLAIIALGLVSLMNIGYWFGTDPKPDPTLAIAVAVLGVAGLVAAYGLARNASWGRPVALAVAGINVVSSVSALVDDTEGAVIGLVASSIALVLAFACGSLRHATSPA